MIVLGRFLDRFETLSPSQASARIEVLTARLALRAGVPLRQAGLTLAALLALELEAMNAPKEPDATEGPTAADRRWLRSANVRWDE